MTILSDISGRKMFMVGFFPLKRTFWDKKKYRFFCFLLLKDLKPSLHHPFRFSDALIQNKDTRFSTLDIAFWTLLLVFISLVYCSYLTKVLQNM